MRLGTPFFIVVSLVHGYVLWSYAIITPRWTVTPGYPLPEPGRTARILSLSLIIAIVFVISFTLHKLRAKKDTSTTILNSIISANIALVLTLVLSQILDSTYAMPSPLIGDTIAQLTNNPSILVAIFVIVNLAAAVSSVIVWGFFIGINKVLGRSTNADADAGS